MRKLIRETVYPNAYLLIISAWLFTLSFIFSNYFSFTTSPQGVRRTLEGNLQEKEEDFEGFLQDTALIRRIVMGVESEQDALDMARKGYGIFVYRVHRSGRQELLYWNTQQTLPTSEMLQRFESFTLEKLPNGLFELLRRRYDFGGGRRLLVCALIPIRWEYFIENDYLRKGFVGEPGIERNYRLSASLSGIPVHNSEGEVLYRVERRPDAQQGGGGWVTILIRIIATLLILFYVNLVAQGVSRHYGAFWAVAFLTTMVVLLRAMSYWFPIPMDLRQFELFSPIIYGSSATLRSLGDLLVNALLFTWVILFTQSMPRPSLSGLKGGSRLLRVPVAAASILLMLAATWSAGRVVLSLVADSAISYEVTNFFKLDVYTAVGFFVMGCVSMGYYILSHILYQYLDDSLQTSLFNKLLLTTAIGLAYLTFTGDGRLTAFGIGLLAWLVVYLLLTRYVKPKGEGRITGGATVIWLLFFSASITVLIFSENRKRELGIRKTAALKLAMKADPSGDYLVGIATANLRNEFLLENLPRFRDPGLSVLLKDSILRANFRGYNNRYETRLFVYDSAGLPLSASDLLTYDTLNTIYTIQGRRTAVADMRYYENDFLSYSYILRRDVRGRGGRTEAVFFMLSNPRNFQEDALYPELIRPSDENAIDRWPQYSYAVYDSLELKLNRNDYPFSIRLDPSELPTDEFRDEVADGYEVLWHKAGAGKYVVVVRKSNFLLEAITLFAYLFCASLLLVGLFQTASLLLKMRFEGLRLPDVIRNTSIRKQIYGTIIFLSIFSFLVIGAVTIVFFINRYERNNREMLSRTIQTMAEELQDRMGGRSMRALAFSQTDTATDERLQQAVFEISALHNADVNLYDEEGNLRVTSQPFVYNEGILSRKMDPIAYHRMKRLRKVQYIQEERYGQLEYLSVYKPYDNRPRRFRAYINIPYFASTMGLKQEISNFLVALINLNAFIFLMAGVISVIITNRITQSFTWIGRKMQEVNLGRHNLPITWDRKDEIGGLVEQYNAMVQKLEASAEALARTEREGAWREMARQVAHEIKNPLTPMKLSIQYLQKAVNQNAPNVHELSTRVAGTLIEQIDHLSRIASEFSQFANIGNVEEQTFDLNEVIRSLILLHELNGRVEVRMELPEAPVRVRADRTQLNRLFTNLLQNAVEAIPEDRPGLVRVHAHREGGHVRVSVADNGSGIPEAMRSRIFTPNFTTKSSGTGLGLAMCKGIVEQAGGRIWFDTDTSRGTTFHVELPVVDGPAAGEEPPPQ